VSFVHLHVHSMYSLLDGIGSPEAIIKRAKELGQPAIALTDHGNMHGAIEFYKAGKEQGITPILGNEFYGCEDHKSKHNRKDDPLFHLILLAKNEEGYRNLLKLTSISALDGHYYKPRIDFGLLQTYHGGLICLSGCIAGEIAYKFIVARGKEEPIQLA